jgi:hypothetical protein
MLSLKDAKSDVDADVDMEESELWDCDDDKEDVPD